MPLDPTTLFAVRDLLPDDAVGGPALDELLCRAAALAWERCEQRNAAWLLTRTRQAAAYHQAVVQAVYAAAGGATSRAQADSALAELVAANDYVTTPELAEHTLRYSGHPTRAFTESANWGHPHAWRGGSEPFPYERLAGAAMLADARAALAEQARYQSLPPEAPS